MGFMRRSQVWRCVTSTAVTMSVTGLITLLAASAVPFSAEAQQTAKPYRIGYLSSHGPEAHQIEVFRHALQKLGLVEGRNLIIDYKSADGRLERLPELAASSSGAGST